VAGLDVVVEVFRQVSPEVSVTCRARDGERVLPRESIAECIGPAWALLIAERTALNFLQRLSGIATNTRHFVDASGGRIIVLDTRKTTPTWRRLEKYAVVVGGARNHRMGLYDAFLIKDNHIRIAGGVTAAVEHCRATRPDLAIEVEAETLAQVEEALRVRADVILLDNMGTDAIRQAVQLVQGRAKVEISGGATLDRIPELASTGADFVSVGALTHSSPAVDISFEIELAT
jgi:nicotinate-nucleotide pyrophosphorylase (carboxylating)